MAISPLTCVVAAAVLVGAGCADFSGLSDFRLVEAGSSGTAGAGGAGGEGAGTSAGGSGQGGCGAEQQCVPDITGAQYVTLSPSCEAGTTALDLKDCAGCACEATPCEVAGSLHDQNNCPGAGAPFVGAGCLNNTNMANPVYVKATVDASCAAPSGEPVVGACPVLPVGTCGAGGLCFPQGQEICLLVPSGTSCPDRYSAQPVQEGGTCGCTCSASGTCPQQARVYTDDVCTMGEQIVNATGVCVYVPGGSNVNAVAAPDATDTCMPTASASGGTPRTLCCPSG